MAVKYIPNNFPWIQCSEPQWTVDGWGYDKAKVTWRGPRPGLKAFLDSLVKFSNMPASNTRYGLTNAGPYPMMYLDDWASTNTTASFPSVELNYIGFRSGTIPPVKTVDSNTAQQVNGQGQYTDPATGSTAQISGTLQYTASRTTYTWFMTSLPPIASPFNYVQNAQNPFDTIIGYRMTNTTSGSQDAGLPVNNIPYAAFVSVLNSVAAQDVVSNYERETLVPNALYACRADVDYKLVS